MRYLLILFLMLISCSKTLQDQESLIINLEKVIPEELSITSFIKSDLESFYEVELSDGTFFITVTMGNIYSLVTYFVSKKIIY